MNSRDSDSPEEISMVNLFLTMQCNRNCHFCAVHSGPSRTEAMPLSLIYKIANELRNWPRVHDVNHPIIRFTGGEPFLYPHLERAINLFDYSPRIEISTNGTLITEQHLEQMAARNVRLNFSVYLDETTHQIIATSELKRVLASDVSNVCVLVAHSKNITAFPHVFDKLEQMGAKLIVIVGVKPYRIKHTEVMDAYLLKYDDVQYIHKIIAQRDPSSTTYTFKEPNTCICTQEKGNTVPGCSCATGHLTILTNGHICPCNSLIDVICGDYSKNSLHDTYNTSKMRFVRAMSKLSVYDLNPCFSCLYNTNCCAGSRVDAYLRTGDWLSVNPHAPCAEKVTRLAFRSPFLSTQYAEM